VGLTTIPAGSFVLDSRDVPAEAVMPWRELPARLSTQRSLFKDKLVLFGARISGSGDEDFRVSAARTGQATLPGVLVQARAIDTILAGFPIREVSGPVVILGTGLLAGVVAACVLLGRRAGIVTIAALGSCPLVAIVGYGLGRRLLPVAAPLVLIASVAILAVLLRGLLPAQPWRKGRP
jgi:CHASE2 domain-containing sensor protein